MSNIEAIELFAKTTFTDKNGVMSTDELTSLISNAKSQQEKDFYVAVYNYLLGISARKVIANGRY